MAVVGSATVQIRAVGDKVNSDVSRILKDIAGTITGLAGSFATITAVGGGIGALVGGVGALAAGLTSLIGPASQAAAAIGVVGASLVGALVQGGAVAIGIFSQLKGEMSELSPAAQGVRTAFDGLKEQFSGLFEEVSGPVFAELENAIGTLGGSLFPTLDLGIRQTANSIGDVIGSFNAVLENPLFQADLAQVMDTNADSISNIGGGFASLTEALFSVLAAASPLIERFTSWFAEWASYISDTAQLGQETGRLTAFFNRAGDVAATLFAALSDVGGILFDIGQAAGPLGTLLLGNFGRAASALNAFLDTDAGRSALNEFFAPDGPMARNLASIGNLAKELGKSFVSLTQNTGIAQIGDALTAVLPGVTVIVNTLVTSLGGIAEAVATAFNSPAGNAGIKALNTGLRDIGGAFERLAPAIGPVLEIFGNLATNLSNALGPAFDALANVLPSLVGPLNTIGAVLGDVFLAAVQAIVPLLPQFAETVADLASAFSGPLQSAIGAVGDILGILLDAFSALSPVLTVLAPLIVAVATGLGTFAIAGRVGGALNTVATSLGTIAAKGGPLAGTLGKLSTGIGALGSAATGAAVGLAVVTAAYAFYSAAVAEADAQEQELGRALLGGGSAARTARADVATLGVTHDALSDALARAAGASTGLGGILARTGIFDSTIASGQDAAAAAEEYTASLTPLERAQQAVTAATNDYALAINEGDTEGAAAAQDRLTAAQAEAERQQRILEDATRTYASSLRDSVSAIYEAQTAELGRSNAQIGAEQGLIGVQRAQERLDAVRADSTSTALDVREAELQLQSAQNGAVASAQAAAQAIGEGIIANGNFANETDAANASVEAQRKYLQDLASQATGPTQEALLGLIEDLEGIPTGTNTKVDVATADAEARVKGVNDGLGRLDRRVDRPTIDLNDDPAKQKLIEVERALAAAATKEYKAQLGANAEPANAEVSKFQASLRKLEAERATAVLDADSAAGQARLNEINARIEDYKRNEASATLTADGTFAGAVITDVQAQLEGVSDYEAIAQINADNTDVVAKVINTNAQLDIVAKKFVVPKIGADDSILVGKVIATGAALDGINARITVAKIGADDSVAQARGAAVSRVLVGINGSVTIPRIGTDDSVAQARMADVKAKMAAIASQNTTPRIGTNDAEAQARMADVKAKMAQLNNTVAVPRTGLNDGSSSTIAGINGSLANLGRINVNPGVTVRDGASGTLSSIRNQIDNIRDKTVTITTKAVTLKSGVAAGGGRINTDQFTTVGEEGRELVFLSQGSYVATAAQTNRILQAARLQSEGALLSANAARTVATSGNGGGGGGVNIPISVVAQRGQSTTEIASETARQLAFNLRRAS